MLSIFLVGCGGNASVGVNSGSGTSGTPSGQVPAAPTGLSATATSTQITLSWSASSGATSYIVERGAASGGPYSQIATPTSTSFVDTGVTDGTAYYYVVVGVNSTGDSAESNETMATPAAIVAAPTIPSGVVATAANQQVTLTWTAVDGASSYIVERSTVSGGPYTQIATPAANSYVDTGLTNGTTDYYVVLSVNSSGSSANSAPVSATPNATTAAPAIPTGVAATAGDASVFLVWGAVSGATSYAIKRSTVGGGPYTQVATTTAPSYANTGLTNGTQYFYVVSAVNGTGASANSAQVSATPSASANVPSAPTGLKGTAGNAEATLTWSAASGATSYVIKRATVSGGPYSQIGTSTSATYLDTGLANGTAYFYVVSAANAAGQGGNSTQVSVTPEAMSTIPAAPTGLAASAGNAQIGLTWTSSAGATSYHVKRATVSGGPYTVVAQPAGASYVDTGLANATAYYYVVSALDAAGESPNSAQASAMPTASTTSAPPAVCTTPFTEDKSATTVTVGTGTAASCTQAALASALSTGGVIRFSCGGAATIHLTSQLTLRTNINTTLDGQGLITLDGGGTTRLLYYSSPNFQATHTVVTIENLTLQNGLSTGTPIATAPSPCSQGTNDDGGGAAIYMRDGILHVWNSVFKNNIAPSLGPDVGGGAIYTLGSLGTTIVGSTFTGNRASNGGAVGALWGDLSIYNSAFTSNAATGNGANQISSSCSVNGGETGDGGNGGAAYMDGGETYGSNVCGSTFTSNSAGMKAFGGAIFRTPDGAAQTTTIDRSSFIDNSAPQGGALYFHNSTLVVTASTLSGNTSTGPGGGVFADGSTLTFTNDTFAGNISQKGLGGAIVLYGNGGTLQNVTFLDNQSTGGSGYYAAAIGGGTALTMKNTLFANNTSNDCYSPMQCQAGSSTGSDNLQWPKTHAICATVDTACSSGTVFSDPEVGALQSNGGPTKTAAPLPGSPAVGLGQNCPSTDQRGIARPASGCTAGAVEGAIAP